MNISEFYLSNTSKYDFNNINHNVKTDTKAVISLDHPKINEELKKIASSKMGGHTDDPMHDQFFMLLLVKEKQTWFFFF